MQDTAAHALWLLVQGDVRRLLGGSTSTGGGSGGSSDHGEGEGEGGSPSGTEVLGCNPLDLVPNLLRLRDLGAAQEEVRGQIVGLGTHCRWWSSHPTGKQCTRPAL